MTLDAIAALLLLVGMLAAAGLGPLLRLLLRRRRARHGRHATRMDDPTRGFRDPLR
jgi:hypothetical protein